jgi:hypothetical protein
MILTRRHVVVSVPSFIGAHATPILAQKPADLDTLLATLPRGTVER